MKIGRRQLLGHSFAAAVASASAATLVPAIGLAQGQRLPLAEKAVQGGQRELVIAGGAGGYLEAVRKHFYETFTEATGIKITSVSAPYGEKATRLKAMHEVGKVEWDIVSLSLDFLNPTVTANLRDLGDCAALPAVAAYGIAGACLRHGVLFEVGGLPMVYSTEAFPSGKPQPQSWADFWNVREFPGPRALPNAGVPWWPLIAALQADGVARENLFPLDLDRAFRKLDQIKPHVGVWWRNGDQSQQILRNKEVVMSMMYSGRAFQLRSQGLPLQIGWQGAPIDAVFYGIARGAPHPDAALAFVDFLLTRPETHAAYSRVNFYDTVNREALSLLSAEDRKARATDPANFATLVQIDRDWVAANRDMVIERWLKWLAQ